MVKIIMRCAIQYSSFPMANSYEKAVCPIELNLMVINKEMIDGLEEGGMAMYIDNIGGTANLFI